LGMFTTLFPPLPPHLLVPTRPQPFRRAFSGFNWFPPSPLVWRGPVSHFRASLALPDRMGSWKDKTPSGLSGHPLFFPPPFFRIRHSLRNRLNHFWSSRYQNVPNYLAWSGLPPFSFFFLQPGIFPTLTWLCTLNN